MKKLSLETLVRHLNGEDVDVTGIKEEIEAELSKGKAKADANRAVYAELHDKVLEVLRIAANPVTAQEIADEIGVARGKVVYGLTNYWADEVIKDTSGKSTAYILA